MRKLVHLGTAAIFACLVFGCSAEKQEAANTTDTQSGEPTLKVTTTETPAGAMNETPAVNFATWTATNIDGSSHTATEWVGKRPVIINFWGTWCPPCRKEIPDLIKLYAEYHPKGVEILGFAVRDQAANVKIFSNEAGMQWVMMMGNDEVLEKYGPITGVPTTIFLDPNGKEVKRFIGGPTLEEFKQAAEMITAGYDPTAQAM